MILRQFQKELNLRNIWFIILRLRFYEDLSKLIVVIRGEENFIVIRDWNTTVGKGIEENTIVSILTIFQWLADKMREDRGISRVLHGT